MKSMLKNAIERIARLESASLQRPAKKQKYALMLFNFYKKNDDETSDDLKQRVISLLSKVGFEQQSQDVVAAKRIGSTTTQMALIEFKSAEAVSSLLRQRASFTPGGARDQQTRAMLIQIKKLVRHGAHDINVRPARENSQSSEAEVIEIP